MIGVVTLLLLSMMAAYIIDGAKPVFANAITIYSSQNWSAITTGSGSGGQPSSTDTITINSGATLIVNIPNAVCASITFNAPSSSGGLNISGTNTLTVGGAIIMNAPTYASTTTLSVGTGTLNAGSIAIKAGTSVSEDSILSVSTGTINVTGAITFSGTAAQAHLTFNGAGTLNIGGNLGTGGAFTCSTGTVNFNGSSAQTFGGYTYNILKSNNTAGITPAAACTITTLILADVTSGSIFNDGGYPISTATTLNLNSGTYYCTTPTFPWGTLNSNTGTVNYSGTGQTLKVTSYYNLTLSGGAETFGAITTIGGNLTLSGSATATTGANLTVSGNLAVGDGTTFTVSGFTSTVTGTTNVGGGGTGGSLVFSSATNPNKTFTGLVTINTNSSWTESAAITPTFSNGITNSGSFTASTGVHTFSTNNQGLTGTFTIPSVTVTSPAVLTNNNTLTVGTALSGTGD